VGTRVFQTSTTCSAVKPKTRSRRAGHDSKKAQTAIVEAPRLSENETRLISYINKIQRCKALVVDTSYKPIDVINWEKAICLDYRNKVWDIFLPLKQLQGLVQCPKYMAMHRGSHDVFELMALQRQVTFAIR
jgi:hypothetical protein